MAEPWDVMLPIFTPPPARKVRPVTLADQERAARVSYRRFKSAKSVHCEDCIDRIRAEGLRYPHQAAWVRTEGSAERLLCQFHKVERETP